MLPHAQDRKFKPPLNYSFGVSFVLEIYIPYLVRVVLSNCWEKCFCLYEMLLITKHLHKELDIFLIVLEIFL